MRKLTITALACCALLWGCGTADDGGDNGGGDQPAATGGSKPATGGAKATGGSSSSSTGGASATGGSSPATGGASGQTGGAPASESPDAGANDGSSGGGSDAAPAGPSTGLQKIFDGTSLEGWTMSPAASWVIKDGAMVSTGAGRGYIFTKNDYKHYRLIFSLKPGGTGGHAPTILLFNTRPPPALDALGGIQFQPPGGSHWDYRPGKNKSGDGFTKAGSAGPAVNGWHTCELVVNGELGEAKMACNGKDVIHYKDATAAKIGPWAIQTHNKGITDAYKDISVEDNITSDEYTTVK